MTGTGVRRILCSRRWAASRDESGLTLIELLIAALLIGVIFSGVASFLINTARALQDNERRISSTALLTQLQEEMQGTPWFDLALYEGELGELGTLTDLDIPDLDLGAGTFEGRDLVTIPGPDNDGCPTGFDDCGRRAAVPEPAETGTLAVGDREFQVARLITWFNHDPDPAADPGDTAPEATKRITTLVAWQIRGGQWSFERFDSERAASTAELGDPSEARIPVYSVSPSLSGLTEPDQRHATDIEVFVRLSRPVPSLGSVELSFYRLSHEWYDDHYVAWLAGDPTPDPVLEPQTVTLSGVAPLIDTQFQVTIPALSHRFPEGTRPFRVTVFDALGDPVASSVTQIGFLPNASSIPPIPDPDGTGGGDVEPPDPDAPDVAVREPIAISPTSVCVGAEDRLLGSVSLRTYVDGMRPEDYSVTITYVADGRTRTESIQPTSDPAAIQPVAQEFERVFAVGGDYGFRPGPSIGDEETTTFTVIATALGGTDTRTSATSLAVQKCG